MKLKRTAASQMVVCWKELSCQKHFDMLDEFFEDWANEIPPLNAKPMLVVGRIMRVANILESQLVQTLKSFDLRHIDFDILATLGRK